MNHTNEEMVGIVGMGLMGQAVSTVLRNAGLRVRGWDIAPERSLDCVSSDELARCSQVLVLCLPTTEICRAVLHTMPLRQGQVIFDTSTGDPNQVVELARELESKGVDYLDSTISGSSVQLAKREVLMMVGGDLAVYTKYQGLLERIAKEVVHVGPAGAGTQMKLVSNLVLGLNRAALAEGLTFASGLGLNLSLTLSILLRSMAYSRIMDTKGAKMVHSDFKVEAKLAQHLKDVRLMLSMTQHRLPLTESHRELLERAVELGLGDFDNSAIIKAF